MSLTYAIGDRVSVAPASVGTVVGVLSEEEECYAVEFSDGSRAGYFLPSLGPAPTPSEQAEAFWSGPPDRPDDLDAVRAEGRRLLEEMACIGIPGESDSVAEGINVICSVAIFLRDNVDALLAPTLTEEDEAQIGTWQRNAQRCTDSELLAESLFGALALIRRLSGSGEQRDG